MICWDTITLADYQDFSPDPDNYPHRPPDPKERDARARLSDFFDKNREAVFFSRQLEVQNEGSYFHWITNRALRDLEAQGLIRREKRGIKTGGSIMLLWHRSFRYYRRSASRLVTLVEEYADPNIGAALRLHGESMILEGFARSQFVMKGRNVNRFRDKEWEESGHDLDFIFEKDGVAYGIEVKNTLGYMNHDELTIKIRLCKYLGIRPVFVVRMFPAHWMEEVRQEGGFVLILKYQLYPWTHKDLAKRVKEQLDLPVDAPRTLYDVTMKRFLTWHEKNL